MTDVARPNRWTTLLLGNLLAGTVVVAGAILCWAVFAGGDAAYRALVSGAVTTVTLFWALFGVQTLRRRRPA